MRKLIFCASALFVGASVQYAYSQDAPASSGFFFGGLNVEYGVGMNLDQLGEEEFTQMESLPYPNSFKPVAAGSYTKPILGTVGSGLTIALTPGYMFTEHIGVEVGLTYFTSSETVTAERSSSQTSMLSSKTTTKSNQFRVLPSLVFHTGGGPIFGYAKVGVLVPAGGSTKFEIHGVQPVWAGGVDGSGDPLDPAKGMVGATTDVEGESKGKFSLGFRGSVGAGYVISDNLSLSLEVFYTSLGIKSNTRSITSRKINGTETIADVPVYGKETEYVDEITSSTNNPAYNTNINTNAPRQDIGARGNYSQVGLSIGVKYRF